MKRLFGTDGIRGVANQTLTGDLAYKVGLATAKLITTNHFRLVNHSPFGDEKPIVLIGTDTRPSKDLIFTGLACGLTAGGANVVSLGIIPTPAVAYLTKDYTFATVGIMVTASHNPKEYNGIKIIGPDGYKLPDRLEEQIEDLISSINDETLPSFFSSAPGRISYDMANDAKEDYISFLMESFTFSNPENLKVAVDFSNGAASSCSDIFERMWFNYHKFNTDLSGENINEGCGSMHLDYLQNQIKNSEMGFDVGIAFDGDADRCLMVDETGEVVDGDHILAIVGGFLKERGKLKNNTIVGTVMSNLGLVKFCEEKSIKFLATKVGDKYVLEEMITNRSSLGGEQSGHIIFKNYATTGDGLLTALMILSIMDQTKLPLSKLKNQMFKYPQVSTQITAGPMEKNAFVANTELMQSLFDMVDNRLNGDGRAVIRPSGTENYIRIMVEGKDLDTIKVLCEDIKAKIIETL